MDEVIRRIVSMFPGATEATRKDIEDHIRYWLLFKDEFDTYQIILDKFGDLPNIKSRRAW